MNILCIGDSYTIGEGLPIWDSYPFQLQRKLRLDNIQASVEIVAKTGYTTSEILEILKNYALIHYHHITIMIGVNNIYRGQSIEQFEKELKQIYQVAKKHTNVITFISIPDYTYSPFGIEKNLNVTRQTNEYNAIVKSMAMRENAHFIDITQFTRDSDVSNYVEDGLHYSKTQKAKWTEQIFPVVKKCLTSNME